MWYKTIILLFSVISFSLAASLPLEPSFTHGVLPNGMKYTIKKNSKPKDFVELRLLVKVGSLDEDEDQKGIAHFVEHMAFNGSKNFKKNDVVKYFESIGVGYGAGLNASTGYGRTLYQLKVPNKNSHLEKSFLFLSDILNGLDFDEKEFNNERGVILEEARSRNTLSFRIKQQVKQEVYGNSKYSTRTPM